MMQATVKITNKSGLHARPANLLVQEANKFKSEITLAYDGQEVNAKSILGVMSLGAVQGSELTVKAVGEDEDKAINDLKEFFTSGLGEE
ncbi:MAG: phosphocarrier protein HPr [Clostridia bacterium]|jgi:phosphocarrier protein|nr:HPr family phosphocarrier protein [Clostridiales bacterium]MDK2985029.1 phosphocarrier protein HPr [Clostridia bacterium]